MTMPVLAFKPMQVIGCGEAVNDGGVFFLGPGVGVSVGVMNQKGTKIFGLAR